MEDQDQEPARRDQSISMTKCSVFMKGLLLNGLDNADVSKFSLCRLLIHYLYRVTGKECNLEHLSIFLVN